MSHLVIPAVLAAFTAHTIAASYADDDDRICDQIVRPWGHKPATLAEVMARPPGPIPASRRLRAA